MSLKSVFMGLGKTLDAPGVGGETFLTRAVKMGLPEVARDFIRTGADPNRPNAAGELPLFIALEMKDRAMIAELIKGGASVFHRQDGVTFKARALQLGMPDIAQLAAAIEKERAAMVAAMSMGCRM
jgi:ankyrin repeat protein